MDLHGADFLDPRVGAVRTVTGGRVVSTEAPLVQTLRFDARRNGSPTRGSRQISGKSRNYRAARTVFKNVREKVLFGRRRTLRTLSDGEISSDRCLYCSQRSRGVDIAGVSTWRNSTAAVIKDERADASSRGGALVE